MQREEDFFPLDYPPKYDIGTGVACLHGRAGPDCCHPPACGRHSSDGAYVPSSSR